MVGSVFWRKDEAMTPGKAPAPGGAPGRYYLRTFGNVELFDPSGELMNGAVAQAKRLALLGYLCCAEPGPHHTRDVLLALFWSDRSESAGRGALNQALYAIRSQLGADAVVSRGPQVVGISSEVVESDAGRLTAALAAAIGPVSAEGREGLARALEVYRGELMDGLYPSGAHGFQEWLDTMRRRVHRDVVAAHQKLAHAYQAADEVASFFTHAQRAAELDPFDEATHRHLLEAYLALGDRGGALREHQAYTDLLAAEFDSSPSPETIRWVRRVFQPVSTAPLVDTVDSPQVAIPEASWTPGRWVLAGAIGLMAVSAGLALQARADPLPGSFVLRSDGSEEARVLATAIERALGSAGAVDLTMIPEDASRAGVVGWVEAVTGGPRTAGVLQLSRDRAGDSIRVELLGLTALPGKVAVQMRLAASTVLRDPADLADRVLGMLTVQLSDDPIPWRRVIGDRPRFSALRAFRRAFEARQQGEQAVATEALREAIRQDPAFVLAWLELGILDGSWSDGSVARVVHGEDTLRFDLMSIPGFERRAPPLPPPPTVRISETERRLIEAALEWGSPRRRLPHLVAAAKVAPELYAGRIAAAAVAIGAYEEAIEVWEGDESGRGVTLGLRTDLAIALHGAGRHKDEWDVVRQAIAEHPEVPHLTNYAIWALAAMGDEESVDEIRTLLSQRIAGGGQRPDIRLVTRAVHELRVHGHVGAADALLRESMERVDWYYGEDEPIPHNGAPALLIAAGDLDRAEETLYEVIESASDGSWDPVLSEWELGLVAAMRDDRERAIAVQSEIEFDPEWVGHAARAEIHFALGDTLDAARLMERALASGMPHYQLRGPMCPGLRTVPRFRRLLRGHPTC